VIQLMKTVCFSRHIDMVGNQTRCSTTSFMYAP
jgi:hypothetical protein